MMIKVLGRKTSSNVQIVMWCLAELGLPCEREDFGHSFGGVNTPEYLAMNPNGLVPVLIDGHEPLFESMAIIRYLAAKYRKDETFWPSDPESRAQIDKWAEWGKNTWGSAVSQGVFWPLVRTSPQDRDRVQFAKGFAEMNRIGAILNERLKSVPYIAGPDFTLADISVGYILYRYFTIDFEREDFPNIRAYYERLQSRSAYTEHAMISYESLRAEGA